MFKAVCIFLSLTVIVFVVNAEGPSRQDVRSCEKMAADYCLDREPKPDNLSHCKTMLTYAKCVIEEAKRECESGGEMKILQLSLEEEAKQFMQSLNDADCDEALDLMEKN